jgi:hypothetical protein
MERRRLSTASGGLSRPQRDALRKRMARLAEVRKKRSAERNEEILAKARIAFKARPVKPDTPPPLTGKHDINKQFFRPGPAAKKATKLGFEIKTADRLIRALQVSTVEDPAWGNIKAVMINEHTPHSEISKIDAKFQIDLIGWSAARDPYFGPNAKFRIATITVPGTRHVY